MHHLQDQYSRRQNRELNIVRAYNCRRYMIYLKQSKIYITKKNINQILHNYFLIHQNIKALSRMRFLSITVSIT